MPQPTALADFTEAFDAWCAHQRQFGRLRRVSSEAVYRAMWQALAAWCVGQLPPLRLRGLDAATLSAYLASRHGSGGPEGSLTPRYQQRLLALVQRVQAHRATQAHQGSAPASARPLAAVHARSASRDAGPDDADLPLALLSPAETQRLQHLLCDLAEPARWQTLRDRCAAALQLGAGLGPGELRALRLRDVVAAGSGPAALPGPLRMAASGSAPAHVAPLADWAAQLLVRWLALRAAQALGGDWLFPSTRSGKPWGKVAQYSAAQRVLAETGIAEAAGGSFRLRHCYAMRQLHRGLPPEHLSRWLGVVDPAVIARYQRALPGWAAAAGTATAAAPTEAVAPRPV
jgi:integrase